jgi:hypothetical protein
VKEEQCLFIECVFFLADCREESFARAFFYFEALFVIIQFGWFIAGFSILLFRADHCCEDVFAHSSRFFQLTRETELSVCAREE